VACELFVLLLLASVPRAGPAGQASRSDPGLAQKVHVASQLNHGKVVVEESTFPKQGVRCDPTHGIPLVTRFVVLNTNFDFDIYSIVVEHRLSLYQCRLHFKLAKLYVFSMCDCFQVVCFPYPVQKDPNRWMQDNQNKIELGVIGSLFYGYRGGRKLKNFL
jgi:hypothetical protein